jgi:hypothetical protein
VVSVDPCDARHTLRDMPLVLVAFDAVLFDGLAAYALIVAARAQSGSVCWLWRLAALPAAVVVGGLHRMEFRRRGGSGCPRSGPDGVSEA